MIQNNTKLVQNKKDFYDITQKIKLIQYKQKMVFNILQNNTEWIQYKT